MITKIDGLKQPDFNSVVATLSLHDKFQFQGWKGAEGWGVWGSQIQSSPREVPNMKTLPPQNPRQQSGLKCGYSWQEISPVI